MSGGENYPDLQNIERSGVYQFNSGLWVVRILWRPKGTGPTTLITTSHYHTVVQVWVTECISDFFGNTVGYQAGEAL